MTPILLFFFQVYAQEGTFKIDQRGIPVVSFGQLLTFAVRFFFVIAGIAALIYMLLGAIAWITSGGDKENITAARDKIQAAIVGVFMLVVVMSIMYTLEQYVFRRSICFGISCDITIPSLQITPLPGSGGALQNTQSVESTTQTVEDSQLPRTGGQ